MHVSVVHTLGNLTLTAYNARLTNDGFPANAWASIWGRAEIQARGRALGQRIASIWPGPDESVSAPPAEPRWRLMNQLVTSLPAGRWTSYRDVAEVIGSRFNTVHARLSSSRVPNAHRVLTLKGQVSPDLRWPDPQRTDDPRKILEAEGIRFDESGRADPEQCMTATDLAAAMGLDMND